MRPTKAKICLTEEELRQELPLRGASNCKRSVEEMEWEREKRLQIQVVETGKQKELEML